jgi:hypothetical protein
VRRNSVFEGFSERRSEAIEDYTLDIMAQRKQIITSKQAVEKEM